MYTNDGDPMMNNILRQFDALSRERDASLSTPSGNYAAPTSLNNRGLGAGQVPQLSGSATFNSGTQFVPSINLQRQEGPASSTRLFDAERTITIGNVSRSNSRGNSRSPPRLTNLEGMAAQTTTPQRQFTAGPGWGYRPPEAPSMEPSAADTQYAARPLNIATRDSVHQSLFKEIDDIPMAPVELRRREASNHAHQQPTGGRVFSAFEGGSPVQQRHPSAGAAGHSPVPKLPVPQSEGFSNVVMIPKHEADRLRSQSQRQQSVGHVTSQSEHRGWSHHSGHPSQPHARSASTQQQQALYDASGRLIVPMRDQSRPNDMHAHHAARSRSQAQQHHHQHELQQQQLQMQREREQQREQQLQLEREEQQRQQPSVPRVRAFHPQLSALLIETVAVLANIRQRPPPQIPMHVMRAWERGVAAGAYFVKYPASGGSPHERFFAIRIVQGEAFQREPHFLWSTHDRSWSCKGRYHLSTLTGLVTGSTMYSGFTKYLSEDAMSIKGPYNNAVRSILPARLSLVLQFNKPELCSMGLICLDEDVFQCWNIVLSFIIDVNTDFVDNIDRAAEEQEHLDRMQSAKQLGLQQPEDDDYDDYEKDDDMDDDTLYEVAAAPGNEGGSAPM